jgi:uncharacterized protein YicC (UPF0701 family)
MIAHEVTKLKSVASRKDQIATERAEIKSTEAGLMQQIKERQAEGLPLLAILDDQLNQLEVTREQLALELAATEAPTEDYQEKIDKLKQQFNPDNVKVAIRKLLFLARNKADEDAKQRLMPIVHQSCRRW